MKYLNDAVLIVGLKKEESPAFEQLYKDNFATVSHYIRQNSGDIDDAKDIFQESLMVLMDYMRKPNFTFTTSVGGFLVSITKRMWLYRLRQSKSFQSTEEVVVADAADMFQFFENQAEEKEERLTAIATQLNNIGEDCKKLLLGFYYESKAMKELALEMEYTDAFIRVKKNRCMNSLKEKMLNKTN
jgi:RNA polymerase sigma factor (sigma-70 family)